MDVDPQHDAFGEQISGIAALSHPISRRVLALVRDRGWVSRDAAADTLEVPRSVAAFHLDKLVDAGLLLTRFERTSGRTGPGAGRPAKLYGRSDREIDVSVPPRRYELAGSLLADAVARAASAGSPVGDVLAEVARETGRRIGDEIGGAPGGPGLRRAALIETLAGQGYEPREQGGEIALLNCPFHRLAQQHRSLVCGMNLDFLTGVLDGIGGTNLFSARLAPEPGYCCVRLDPAAEPSG